MDWADIATQAGSEAMKNRSIHGDKCVPPGFGKWSFGCDSLCSVAGVGAGVGGGAAVTAIAATGPLGWLVGGLGLLAAPAAKFLCGKACDVHDENVFQRQLAELRCGDLYKCGYCLNRGEDVVKSFEGRDLELDKFCENVHGENCYEKINLFKPLWPPSPINLIIYIIIIILLVIAYLTGDQSIIFIMVLIFCLLTLIWYGYNKRKPFDDYWIEGLSKCPSALSSICSNANGSEYVINRN